MQRAAAQRASPGPRRLGQIGIAGEQQLMECGVGQQVLWVQRMCPPARRVPTAMAKPGRDDPAPVAVATSTKSVAWPRRKRPRATAMSKPRHGAEMAATVAHRHERAAAHRLPVDELTAAVAARLRKAEQEDAYEDELDAASNAVVHLVQAARLDEAEAAARRPAGPLPPDVHDGWDRLGMVHEARGNSRQAADCYRKVIDFIRQHPEQLQRRRRRTVRQARQQARSPWRPECSAIARASREGEGHATIRDRDQIARHSPSHSVIRLKSKERLRKKTDDFIIAAMKQSRTQGRGGGRGGR